MILFLDTEHTGWSARCENRKLLSIALASEDGRKGSIMILFLDFDGVLHPYAVYLERGRPVLRAEGALFQWAGLLVDALASHPEVEIVLSTSWARELRFTRARDYLPTALRSRVIGATWHSAMASDERYRGLGRETWWDQATRYQQIRRYVDRAQTSQWIAIDDQPEGWPDRDRDRLVQTDSVLGLSAPSARLCLAHILGDTQSAYLAAAQLEQAEIAAMKAGRGSS